MSHAERLQRSPSTFRRLSGLTPVAFSRLLGEVAAVHERTRTRRASRPGRWRKAGAGRKPALPLADQLLMRFGYYRTYVPHTFLGFLFGLDGSNVSRRNRRLEPCWPGSSASPSGRWNGATRRSGRFSSTAPSGRPPARCGAETVRRGEEDAAHAQDARRGDAGAEASESRRVRIAAVSKTFPGSTHDKKVYDRPGVTMPPGVAGCGDTAYLGTGLTTPRRTPRGG